MVSLKRNSKLELVEAKGRRTRASSIYTPGQLDDFKVSRGKFSTFMSPAQGAFIWIGWLG